jgi:hypothetical protein
MEKKWFDEDALALIKPSRHSWNGMYGVASTESEEDNLGREHGDRSNLYLRWDCYARVPVSKKTGEIVDVDKIEDDIEYKLVWAVFVGNSLEKDDCVCLRVTDEFDPDCEIPIKEIRANPDSSDMLYHTFLSEVIESPYAADCALMNTALDNMALVNDPPTEVLHNAILPGNDYSFKPGAVWLVRVPNAVRNVDIRDTTMQTVAMRQLVEEECKRALATDPAKVGEYAGARATATEIMRVTSATDVTIAVRLSYIIGQFLPWVARKYISYCRDFMPEEVMRRMVNEVLPSQPVGKYIGDYEVHVDIVTQYEDEMMQRMVLTTAMQVLLSNPLALRSDTHTIDVGALVKKFLEVHKLPVGEIVVPPNPMDSENNARHRIHEMLLTGQYIPPSPSENLDSHLRVAMAEKLRWAGLENSGDPRASNLPLIDRYITDLQNLMKMKSGPAAPSVGAEGPVGVPETPGAAVGEQVAAQLGMVGGPYGILGQVQGALR